MKFLTTLFLVTIIFQSNAQLENRSGEFALDKIKYINLIANLEPVYQRSPSRPVALDLADAFYFTKKYEKALMYYENALLEGPISEAHVLNYFSALYENGDFELARTVAKE